MPSLANSSTLLPDAAANGINFLSRRHSYSNLLIRVVNLSIDMRAIVLSGFGGLESLVIMNLPDPQPKAGHILIAVKAFGVNHAETHMRKGEWAEAAEVSGIECVGEV